MIELRNISRVFQTREIETHALNSVNLGIEKGEFVSIMGPSGCGKSTLLNIIGLLDQPNAGVIELEGQEISLLNEKDKCKIRNQKIGFVFQNFHLIPALNVLDNVELPLLYRANYPEKRRRERALEVLEKVGLLHRLKHFPSQLSGGQCQRVAIARAIIGEPQLILADEPTGNLDSRMGDEIIELLSGLNNEGTTIVMVTHDERIANKTHRIVRMLDGKIQ